MEGARRRKIEGEKEGSSSEDEEADLNDEINTEELESLNEEKLLLKRLVQNGKRKKALEKKDNLARRDGQNKVRHQARTRIRRMTQEKK